MKSLRSEIMILMFIYTSNQVEYIKLVRINYLRLSLYKFKKHIASKNSFRAMLSRIQSLFEQISNLNKNHE